MTRQRVKARKISPQPDMAILAMAGPDPLFRGDGKWDYVCPSCDRVLAERVDQYFIERMQSSAAGGVIARCGCGEHSAFPRRADSRLN